MELAVSNVISIKAQIPVFTGICACLAMADNISLRASLSA